MRYYHCQSDQVENKLTYNEDIHAPQALELRMLHGVPGSAVQARHQRCISFSVFHILRIRV